MLERHIKNYAQTESRNIKEFINIKFRGHLQNFNNYFNSLCKFLIIHKKIIQINSTIYYVIYANIFPGASVSSYI